MIAARALSGAAALAVAARHGSGGARLERVWIGGEQHLDGRQPAVADDGVVASGATPAWTRGAHAVAAAQPLTVADPLGAQGAVGLRRPAYAQPCAAAPAAAAIAQFAPVDDQVAPS